MRSGVHCAVRCWWSPFGSRNNGADGHDAASRTVVKENSAPRSCVWLKREPLFPGVHHLVVYPRLARRITGTLRPDTFLFRLPPTASLKTSADKTEKWELV
jgi:hypothetical protein